MNSANRRLRPPAGTRDAADFVMESLPPVLALLRGSDIHELELEEGGVRVRLRRTPAAARTDVADVVSEPESAWQAPPGPAEITAPLVGTFYRAGKPGMAPLVEEGSRVERDTVVGIIEALHVLTDVEAGCSGVVTRALATDGQPVEYGQRLFEVSPA